MNWNFKSISSASTLSKSAFADGEQVVCLIYKDIEKGEIGRADIRLDELDRFELPGNLLGRWRQQIKKAENGQVAVRRKIESAEDFFLSLYESTGRTEACEEMDALKCLLALMLERKRIVRAHGKRQRTGIQPYIHIKTKQKLDVPVVEISADIMVRIQETVGDIIL